jgi:UDP-N-acetylmuramyl pentapeptide synthase
MSGFGIIRPDIVVVTFIGSEHNRSLGTLEVTRHEKAEMVRALPATGIAVLNGDDPNVLWMRSQTPARIVTFGFGEANDIRATDVVIDWPRGTKFRLCSGYETRDMTVRLLGQHMLAPILAAVAVAREEGLTLDEILPPLQQLAPTTGRLEPISLPNGTWIIRDDTKSTTETIHAALDVLARIPARRRILALGEVSEPVGGSGPVYRQIGERLAGIISCGVVIGTHTSFRRYTAGATRAGLARSVLFEAGHSAQHATAILRNEMQPGDVLLIKGRFEQRLERIALSLMGRTVRCDIEECRLKATTCANCPMLERDWKGLPPVT